MASLQIINEQYLSVNLDGLRLEPQLVDTEITAQSKIIEKAAGKMQFWYKRTRDENKVLAMIEDKETSVLANIIMSRRP